MTKLSVAACVFYLVIGGSQVAGQDRASSTSATPTSATPTSATPTSATRGKPNIQSRTAGGMQFWTDELLFHDWRIQRNAYFGHFRLLDGKNVRHAWGSFSDCHSALQRLKREQGLVPMSGKAVIALHGLGRTRSAMDGICQYLRDNGNYTVLNMTYASTRNELGRHARSLASVIDHLDGIEQIDLIGHSFGNLVIRHYLGDQIAMAPRGGPDHRIRRIVMLAPPNNGAQLAVRFRNNPLFSMVWGKSGDQLASDWDNVRQRLAIPRGQFGIIAGGGRGGLSSNPLLKGDDDLVVTVEETRLAGAHDFLVVPVLHTFIMDDDHVRRCTLRFLEHGHFVSGDQRQPIPWAEDLPRDRSP